MGLGRDSRHDVVAFAPRHRKSAERSNRRDIMASTTQLLDRFVELFNTRRFEEAEQDFAPGGSLEEVGPNRRFTPQEATQSSREWVEAFPDAQGTITTKVVEGNKGAAEIIWRGTNRGALMGNPATGKSVTVRATVVIETDGNKITRIVHYIDMAGMMAQLGVAPSMQASA